MNIIRSCGRLSDLSCFIWITHSMHTTVVAMYQGASAQSVECPAIKIWLLNGSCFSCLNIGYTMTTSGISDDLYHQYARVVLWVLHK